NKHMEIIVTLTPSRVTAAELVSFFRAGMSIARINASHCTISDIDMMIDALRLAIPECPIMLDLPGPEYRLFGYETPIMVNAGDRLIIQTESGRQDYPRTNYPLPLLNLSPGQEVLFMNGELKASLDSCEMGVIRISFQNGGILRPNAHIIITGVHARLPYISAKDKALIEYGLARGVDMIALSMVSTADDVCQVRNLLARTEVTRVPDLVVKYETYDSLQNISAIIEVADAIFVARGDMALSIDSELIPIIQKDLISRCNQAGKPVYVATQILSTMVTNAFPLRAEVSDLANAVLDGCNGITLSEETAIGKYPLLAIETARRIIQKTLAHQLPYQAAWQDDPLNALLQRPDFKALFREIRDIASRIWQMGCAEANAGNLSINITELINKAMPDTAPSGSLYYLVSRTGSRYREYGLDL
ncbi:MAG: pyruvate kinase, partial [Candidatus Cloacimonadaceae bacterium]|nr:pyruvate kinase [Candidatus Cloacimonadaceae bacterium]